LNGSQRSVRNQSICVAGINEWLPDVGFIDFAAADQLINAESGSVQLLVASATGWRVADDFDFALERSPAIWGGAAVADAPRCDVDVFGWLLA
jgi:hypothetical protein